MNQSPKNQTLRACQYIRIVKHIAVLTKNLYNENLSYADITRINSMPYDELLILREILLIAYEEEFNTVLILDTKELVHN